MYDFTLRLPNGRTAFFNTSIIPVLDEKGNVIQLLGTGHHTKKINNNLLISIIMNNIQKTQDWIMMALEDHGDSNADFNDGRYPSSVFHAQQCTEKTLKALLSFFGIAHEKTHFPSDILGENILNDPEITSKLQLNKEQIQLMLKMTELASIIEGQRTMLRYSIEILNLLTHFFSSINTQEMVKLAGEISKCLKK
jgi:HEPN domain-containing protein